LSAARVRRRSSNSGFNTRFWDKIRVADDARRAFFCPHYHRTVLPGRIFAPATTRQYTPAFLPPPGSVAAVNEKPLRRRPDAGTGNLKTKTHAKSHSLSQNARARSH
jgi:hypothetical protein